MASTKKPQRRRKGFMEGPDQVLRLSSLYRVELFGHRRATEIARMGHAEFDDVASPDPLEDLDDSELSDRERRDAIARERWRRERRD
jgi:hypothetical protein